MITQSVKVCVTFTGFWFMNKMITRLPVEMHLPRHNFTGPGTKRHLSDGTPKSWSKSTNRVEQAPYHHVLWYAQHKNTASRNSICDKVMIDSLDTISNPSLREKRDRSIVRPINGTKVRFELGIKKNRWTDELAVESHKPIVCKF